MSAGIRAAYDTGAVAARVAAERKDQPLGFGVTWDAGTDMISAKQPVLDPKTGVPIGRWGWLGEEEIIVPENSRPRVKGGLTRVRLF